MASRGVLGAASLPFIGCVCLLVAMVLHILSFASPFWAANDEGDFGLWRHRRCVAVQEPQALNDEACFKWDHLYKVADWLHAVRALESITIVFWSIPLVVLPIYIYVALGLYYRCLLSTMTVFCLIGVACNIAGVIVFGVHIESESELSLRWCLPVAAVAGFFGILCVIVFFKSSLNRPKLEPEKYLTSGFYVDPYRNSMYVVENVDPVGTNGNGSTVIIGPDKGYTNPAVVS